MATRLTWPLQQTSYSSSIRLRRRPNFQPLGGSCRELRTRAFTQALVEAFYMPSARVERCPPGFCGSFPITKAPFAITGSPHVQFEVPASNSPVCRKAGCARCVHQIVPPKPGESKSDVAKVNVVVFLDPPFAFCLVTARAWHIRNLPLILETPRLAVKA